jgi:very-short-patch-repair endonuclease
MVSRVVDFYCHECKVAVELDGNFHVDEDSQQYDKSRTASLSEIGITVLRFWNSEVMQDATKVLQKISKYLA